MDSDELGEIPTSDVKDLFRRAQIATVSIEHTMATFAARMNKQVRDTLSQPPLLPSFIMSRPLRHPINARILTQSIHAVVSRPVTLFLCLSSLNTSVQN